jgi:hypothetical protein
MSNYHVTRLNVVAGKGPVGYDKGEDAFWEQVQQQAKRILEEAQEMYDGAMERDIVEVIDGNVDVWVTREYMDDLLKAVGVDTCGVEHEVNDNNNTKMTRNKEFAQKSAIALYPGQARVVGTEYDGEKFYMVIRNSDNKFLKLIDYCKPNLLQYIPADFDSKFSEEKV